MSIGNVIIVKLLNVPRELLQKFPVIAYSLLDGIAVMSLRPNLDSIRRKELNDDSRATVELPSVIHLVFDDGGTVYAPAESSGGATNFLVSHLNPYHFDSFEKFSNLVISLGLPDLRLPEQFWFPVQSVLTYRELEILNLVYQGYSSKQIAANLTVSPRTIELHRQNCSGKMGQITPELLEALFSTKVMQMYDWAIERNISVTKPRNYNGLAAVD